MMLDIILPDQPLLEASVLRRRLGQFLNAENNSKIDSKL
jgi:hypothetical protein